jgi:hypothetical protein
LQLSYYFAALKSVVGDSLRVSGRVSAQSAFFGLFVVCSSRADQQLVYVFVIGVVCLGIIAFKALLLIFTASLLLLYCFCLVIASVLFFPFEFSFENGSVWKAAVESAVELGCGS